MEHISVQMLSQLTSLSEEEKLAIVEAIPIKSFEKGTYLLKQGQVARNSFFVIEGCIREYELLDGEERTTAFYTEEDAVANFSSMSSQSPSKQNWVCVERTTLTVLNVEKEEQLYQRFPRFETFCRTGMEQMMGAKQEQMARFMGMKPEQRYQILMEERPDLLNRVPQYQLASYLGISPETLSRIRRRIIVKR